MSLAAKLQLKPGQTLRTLNAPSGVAWDDVRVAKTGEALLLFAKNKAQVDEHVAPVIESAKADRLTWIAYPKAGQLGTDLNRDRLWKHVGDRGIKPVRNISLDAVWSALRFRPA